MIIEKRKRLPPYVSYRTFYNFLERLQQHIPSRIDRSYWGDLLSGSTGTQLMAALRFLNLVDINGKPTELLKPLVESRGEARTRLLYELTNDAFDFVCQGSLDLQSATYAQLQEVFHHTFQLTEDVSRKCVKFFIAIARDAQIPISPFILKRTRSTYSTTGIKTGSKKVAERTSRNAAIPQAQDEIPKTDTWDSMLLAKFPDFDPSWSDDLKMKWFAAFDELLKKGLNKS
jgi:hypothetical protein